MPIKKRALLLRRLRNAVRGEVKEREPLCRHTTFRIGGPADIFFVPDDEADLRLALRILQECGQVYFLLGGGSNVLAGDEPLAQAIVGLRSAAFRRLEYRDECVWAGAGVRTAELVRSAAKQGRQGCSFLAGIPGTLGGAVAMNAGSRDYRDPGKIWSLRDCLAQVRVMDACGNIRDCDPAELAAGYRQTGLRRNGEVVLGALLRLPAGDAAAVREEVFGFLERKKKTQDLSRPSAGCIFKNPPQGPAAGWLIEQCGLKGARIGGAVVSTVHANFIVNEGTARCADVVALIEQIRRSVAEKFGLDLETEIQILGKGQG
ncbi:MAG: UDP-N-acetylmuramate dehydrogenase [Candidatus Omnitrophica bacterium]|nr:UDP-N-acetylmuramate dehydrogenase [Candidatus Omnitrophota bacterium]